MVHQQELRLQFLERKALALRFYVEQETARAVVVHQQELRLQFLERKAQALRFFAGFVILRRKKVKKIQKRG